MHIEVMGQYEIVLEAYANLANTGWQPFVTIYRGRSTSRRSLCVVQRQQVQIGAPARSRDQAIEAARAFAAQRIAARRL
ncbi:MULTISPECIES: hypothetical protein [Herbaspirillum]|jgi:hypothetical protein|uniref:Uncharacterized protein n=1 Tax=Herbaspirillum aquaticum TaxID=568783 RepID=A0A225SWK5_9BURK|nr:MULTISPECIES: hypothetical protein [Herbaspirillum]MBW9331960.1 hypothetical protein [Herbaspirillum sp. RU 5E]MRT28726.1 hypothetical protein [Herbaspirillum sp. CAH-3]OWY35581.1 hypothetical protein CEJ45_07145 [Herbaspirillum aquaticum]